MTRARRVALGLYLLAVFASVPYTPWLVKLANARLGPDAAVVAAGAVLAVAAVVLLRRLLRARPPFPLPHLALAGLALAALAAWRLLASSPIALVHLPEYGLLALLAGRALGAGTAAALGGGAAAAAIGLLDELIQGVTPGRVFDWWDVALNAAAALLGASALAWWRWTGAERA